MSKRATVSVKVEGRNNDPYQTIYDSVQDGVLDLSITETCRTDLDIARLLKRLAVISGGGIVAGQVETP